MYLQDEDADRTTDEGGEKKRPRKDAEKEARVVLNGEVCDWRLEDEPFLLAFRLPGAQDKAAGALAERNPLARDARICFDEAKHRYTIRNGSDLAQAPWSVTGFVQAYHEHFDSDKAVQAMRRSSAWRTKRLQYMRSDGSEMSNEEIKEAWATNGRVQSARGTLMHYHIEQHLNGCVIAEPRSQEFKQFLVFEEQVMRTRGLLPFRTELSVFHCGLRLAGQIDLLAQRPDGHFAILDWKRSKKISSEAMFRRRMRAPFQDLDDCNFFHYALQLNVYAYILRTEYGLQVRELLLGVFHPTQSAPICVQLPSLQREVEAAVQALKREGRASDSVPGADSHFHGEPV